MAKRPPVAQTAFGTMVIVACEQHVPHAQRLVDDNLAAAFLPPGLRFVVRACRWPSLRNLLIRATEKKAHGVWGSIGYRKRYIDERVLEALQAGVGAVVIRAWHFGIAPGAVGRLLREYGWMERKQVGGELASKYVEPTGRDLPVSEIERITYAEKL